MAAIQFHPYLMFTGNCRQAFEFYQSVLGGQIETMMTHGESPAADQVSKDWQDTIIHASLRIGSAWLMGSDAPPEYHKPMSGFAVNLSIDDMEEGRRIFGALSQGGNVTMPFEKTFWSDGFGMCTDRFGVPWMVNHAPVEATSEQATA